MSNTTTVRKSPSVPPQSIPCDEPWGLEALMPLNMRPMLEQARKTANPGSALALLLSGGL